MNKKFFGLFLVAAALFSVGTLESCKDNDSDLYNEVLIKETQHYNDLKGRIDAIESQLCKVDCETVKADVDALKEEVKALKEALEGVVSKDDLDALTPRVDDLEAQNEEILERIATLEEQMKLKGITVHSVYTPSFGSFNSSFGLNSNILLGYYGSIANGDPNFGSDGLEGGDVVSKNLGTVYLTIDPLNVDFTGYDVNLVNSLGESAGVTMTALAKSEHDIKLGYTRAEVNNYLYETTAEIASADDVQHVTLNTQGYKDALKDIISYEDGVNFSNIASLIYNTVHTNLSANAVEVSHETESVISKYEISAAVVKPLSISTVEALASIDGNAISSKLSSAANKVVNKVQSALVDRFGKKLVDFKVDQIELALESDSITVKIPAGSIKIDFDVTVDVDVTVGEEQGGGSGTGSGTGTNEEDIEIKISTEEFTNMFGSATDDINKMVDMVNDYISKINNAWTTITTGSGSAIIDKAVEVIVNKTLSIADRASHLANPTLFVVDGDKLKRLSTIEAAPTVLENATVELIPSSNSLELIVPFYKKYLSATGVSILAKDGTDINGATFDGTTLHATMNVTASGVTAITYQVADYAGEIRQATYYIKK